METPAPKPSRLKKFFRRALFVLAVLITLAALFVSEEHWRGNRAWRDYKSAMEARGERFDAARLIPPKVPDDENFAACPYLAHDFEKPSEKPGWTDLYSNLPDNFFAVSEPFRPSWPYGLSAYLTNYAVAFPGGAAFDKTDPAQAAAIVLDHLKACEPVLAQLRAAATRRYCRFNVPYEEWTGPRMEQADSLTINHLTDSKRLFQVLALRARAELAAGQTDEALADIHLMFRLDDGLKDEPLLISQLVRYATVSYLLQPAAEGLAERRWSDAQLRVLQEWLGQTDFLASAVRSFYGERDILANPFRLGPVMSLLGWDRMEQLNYNRAFQEIFLPRINLASREINPAVGHACDLALTNFSNGSAWIHHSVMAVSMPPVSGMSKFTAIAQTDVDLLTVACALERYRLAEGTYPDKLESLTPRFITPLPHDIINGQPLKYRRNAGGKFILYSVGWNEKDDGGVIATNKYGNQDRLQGDWVLEYPK